MQSQSLDGLHRRLHPVKVMSLSAMTEVEARLVGPIGLSGQMQRMQRGPGPGCLRISRIRLWLTVAVESWVQGKRSDAGALQGRGACRGMGRARASHASQ